MGARRAAASNGGFITRLLIASLIASALLATHAFAQTTEPNVEASPKSGESLPEAAVDEVVVTGEQPGPGLWKVTHGGTNVVWVLGTTTGIPTEVKWRSRQVEEVIAHAQAVVFGEQVSPNIGLFRGLLLLPALLKARYNPDKALLKDLVLPEQHERWLALRKKYLKDDKDYERVRPMLIAMQLLGSVAREAGLNSESSVARIVEQAARKYSVPVRLAEINVDLANPKQLIRDFVQTTPREKDVACFSQTLDNLDSDLQKTKSRAIAWAVGDVEAFRQLPAPISFPLCMEALTSAPTLQLEFTRIKEGLDQAWLWEVQKALELNAVTLAVTSLDDVLSPTGRLARLRQRGYSVEAP